MKSLVVITGGGSGIGRALALELIGKGLNVLVVGRREAPLASLKSLHPDHVISCVADVSCDAGVKAVVAHIPDGYSISSLVHNAASIEPTGPLMKVDAKAFAAMLATNVTAPLMLTRACLSHLQDQARILIVGSGVASFSAPGMRAYSVSKAATYNLYLGLKAELHGRVACAWAMPGIVDTPMMHSLIEKKDSVTDFQCYDSMKKQQHLVQPEQVAQFFSWLLLNTSPSDFSDIEWDIYDDEYQSAWNSGGKVSLPPMAAT